jgi:hypothetical protein
MSKILIFSILLLTLSCGKKTNEVEGQPQNVMSVSSLTNSYPEIIRFSVDHMDQDPLSRMDIKTASLQFANKPYSLTQWIVENVFFRYHYEENGFEKFTKLNRLKNGVILPLQQSFYEYLQKNDQFPNINIQVDLKETTHDYQYHVGFVNVKSLEILPYKVELYQAQRNSLKTKVLNIDEINQFLKRDYQPVIFWEKTNRSRLNVYVVDNGDVRTIELEGTEKRDLLSILSTDLRILNFNEFSDREDILGWNPYEDFWICFPCDANKIGSFGSAYLVKTNVASLIRSNRQPNVAHARFSLNKDILISNLKPFDRVHLNLKFIEIIPTAVIPGGVVGSSLARDCINTSRVLSHYNADLSRPSRLLASTFLDWGGEMLSLRDFLLRENITFNINSQNEIEFSVEISDFNQIRFLNKTESRSLEVIFEASEMTCGDRVMHQWPQKVEIHNTDYLMEMRMIVDGLSR